MRSGVQRPLLHSSRPEMSSRERKRDFDSIRVARLPCREVHSTRSPDLVLPSSQHLYLDSSLVSTDGQNSHARFLCSVSLPNSFSQRATTSVATPFPIMLTR